MFTGIVQDIGVITGVERSGDDLTLVIEAPLVAEMAVGGSVAVNGTCLTAVGVEASAVTVNVVPETSNRTNLGLLGIGSKVNLELPMTPSATFDGHIVQGHVDGVATVAEVQEDGDSLRMRLSAPRSILRYLVEKGSVTVDGASLTVVSVDDDSFSVAVIPHTREATTLGGLGEGDRANIEVDILAKYVERLLAV